MIQPTKAFNLFTVLVPVVALVLWVLGQVTLAGVLAIIALEVAVFAAYLVFIARAQKTM